MREPKAVQGVVGAAESSLASFQNKCGDNEKSLKFLTTHSNLQDLQQRRSQVKKGCSAAGGGRRSPGAVREPAWAFGDMASGSHDSGTWKPRFLALQPKTPLWVFPAAGLFRLMQPPASLPHIVLGSG